MCSVCMNISMWVRSAWPLDSPADSLCRENVKLKKVEEWCDGREMEEDTKIEKVKKKDCE